MIICTLKPERDNANPYNQTNREHLSLRLWMDSDLENQKGSDSVALLVSFFTNARAKNEYRKLPKSSDQELFFAHV